MSPSFNAAQRGNWGMPQTLQVLVDGTVVGTFNTVAGTAYAPLSTSSFTVAAGAHTVTFQGTNLNGGDSTILLDQVAITQQQTGLGDSGFEASVMPNSGFDYLARDPASVHSADLTRSPHFDRLSEIYIDPSDGLRGLACDNIPVRSFDLRFVSCRTGALSAPSARRAVVRSCRARA